VLAFPDSLHRYMRLSELVIEHLERQHGRGEELASSVQLEHP
jgi:hypothetical protein